MLSDVCRVGVRLLSTWLWCITWQFLWSEMQCVIRVKTKQFTKIMLIWPLLWEKNCFVAATKAFWNYKSIFNGPIEYAYAYRRIYALFTCKHIRVHMYFNMLTRNDIDIVKVPSITPTISMGQILLYVKYYQWNTAREILPIVHIKYKKAL